MTNLVSPLVSQELIDKTIYNTYEHSQLSIARLVKNYMGSDVISWEAHGCYITDVEGNKYLDFNTMQGVASLGHSNPEVIKAVTEQLNRMPQHAWWRFHSIAHAEFCEVLFSAAPGKLKRCSMYTAATESIECALKTARALSGRKRFISSELSFHGNTLGSLSACGAGVMTDTIAPLLPCDYVRYGDFDAIKRVATREHAAIILEVMQASTNSLPPPDFFHKVRDLCDELGIYLIIDETVTGMGRTGGKLFGIEHHGIAPDFLILGKGLSGGVIGASVCMYTEDTAQKLLKWPYMFHGSTFGGNELACVAAKTALEITIRDRLPERCSELSAYLYQELDKCIAEYPQYLEATGGIGLCACLDVREVIYAAYITVQMHQVHRIIFYVGVVPDFGPPIRIVSRKLRLMPALIATRTEIDLFIKGLRASLESMHKLIQNGEFAALEPKLKEVLYF